MILRRPILTLFVEPPEEILSAVGRNSSSRPSNFCALGRLQFFPGQGTNYSQAGNKSSGRAWQPIRPSMATHQAEPRRVHSDDSDDADSDDSGGIYILQTKIICSSII